jgi:predicted DNA-binding transcriptional regulator AlpA
MSSTLVDTDQIMTTADLARFLKADVSTVYRYKRENTGPPAIEVNGLVRYRRADVEAWLSEHTDAHPPAPSNPLSLSLT